MLSSRVFSKRRLPPEMRGMRPYVGESAWNTPIPAGAEVDNDSTYHITLFRNYDPNGRLGTNNTSFAIPIYFVHSTVQPMRSITVTGLSKTLDLTGANVDAGSPRPIPIPPGTVQSNGSDGAVCLIDLDTGDEWNIRQWHDDTSTCTNATRFLRSMYRDGHPHVYSNRGMGGPYMAGLLRPWEILSGEIRHALALALPFPRSGGCVYPATKTDGAGTHGEAPEGARLQLDPTLDVSTLGLTSQGEIIARCLQKYGAIIADTGGSWKVKCEDTLANSGASLRWGVGSVPYMDDTVTELIPLNYLRVLRLPDAYKSSGTPNWGATCYRRVPSEGTQPAATQTPPTKVDTFASRTTSGEIGTSSGNRWWRTATGGAMLAVSGGVLTITHTASPSNQLSHLYAQAIDQNILFRFKFDKLSTQISNPIQIYAMGRVRLTTADFYYRVRCNIMSTPQFKLRIERYAGASVVGSEVSIAATGDYVPTPNTWYWLRAKFTGVNPTLIEVTLWKDLTIEPGAPQLSETDSTAILQVPGDPGIRTNISSTATFLPVVITVDDFSA